LSAAPELAPCRWQTPCRKNVCFGENAGFVTLTIATAGSTPNFWNVDANGNWTTAGNWTLGAAPNSVGASANFGGGGADDHCSANGDG
jgi:hypothetical protein